MWEAEEKNGGRDNDHLREWEVEGGGGGRKKVPWVINCLIRRRRRRGLISKGRKELALGNLLSWQ